MSTIAADKLDSEIVRALDTNEALFHAFAKLGAFTTAQIVRIEGTITHAVFREALWRLTMRHPKTTWRIVPTERGPMWEQADAPMPFKVLAASEVHAAPRVAADALEQSAADDALLRVSWAADRDEHLVCLAIHHSLADGLSASQLAIDLVALLNEVSEGRPASAQETPAPLLDDAISGITLSTALAHRLTRLQRRLRRPLQHLPFDASAPASQRHTRVVFDTLPRWLVERLTDRARQHDATIGGALTAAVLTALYKTEAIDQLVEVSTQVSLRGRAVPAIPDDAVGCYSGRVTTRHRPTSAFWELAAGCTKTVKRAVERGEPEAAIVRSRGRIDDLVAHVANQIDDPAVCGRQCVLSVSNRGARTLPRSNQGIRLLKLFSATANHALGASLQLSCTTLHGEAHYSLIYVVPLLSESRAQSIWAAALDALLTA